ncbi:MAG: ParB/RepB/Spo0J family partition protein [Candidatus Ancaeobacter aquaticus]|nr:ParB/RepB/Spo0J family partition protein [Candidatus Ancaeobacter aquaticus]
MKLVEVPIKNILLEGKDFDDYIITFPDTIETVLESIKDAGILNPPRLIQAQNGTYKIICGMRRIKALKSLKKKTVSAFVYTHNELGDDKALIVSITDNVSSRVLNPIELSRAIIKLQSLCNYEKDATSRLLSIPASEKVISDYISLQILENDLALLIAQGVMTAHQGYMIAALRHNDRIFFSSLIKTLGIPNQNETKELIQHLTDLKIMLTKDSFQSITKTKCIADTLKNNKLTGRKKAQELIDTLRILRYPHLTGKEKTCNTLIQSLHLPPSATLSFPRYFEGNTLKLEYKIRSEKDITDILQKLNSQSNTLKKLLQEIAK